VHTSTVTVAVMDDFRVEVEEIPSKDLKIEWYSGTGAGGQYRNKHQNSCRITHTPSGLVVKAECRSRQNSFNEAISEINQRVYSQKEKTLKSDFAVDRKSKVGSGQRGDKIRTYRFQDDVVHDHVSDKRARCSDVMRGRFDLLWL